MNWDEIVYASQLGIDQVPMSWGPHRAWGSVLLIAPVVAVTKSILVLRTYLVVLAGLGMFAAFSPWISAFGRRAWTKYTATLASLIFGSQWLTIFHGPIGLPNLWLAFALIGGAGYFLRAAQRPTSAGLFIGAFTAFAIAAVFRPTDTIAAATPIVLTLLIRQWRRPRAVGAVAAGVAVGTAPWIVEAFLRFGGPFERLQTSSQSANAGLRLRLVDQLYASDGPYTLCIGNLCNGVSLGMAIWWICLPLLGAAGVCLAWRRWNEFRSVLLALACAAFFSGPYFILVGDSHPRFLLPTYAFLAIGAAYFMLVTTKFTRNVRWLGPTMMTCVLLFQVRVHLATLRQALDVQAAITSNYQSWSAPLREEGLRAPCLLYGDYAVGLSYEFGCNRVQTSEPPCPSSDVRDLVHGALANSQRVVLIVRDEFELCGPFLDWRRVELDEKRHLTALLSPE